MEVIFRFETRELEIVPDKTYYNHIFHKVSNPKFGFTHICEIYDDVSDYPRYELGVFSKEKFIVLGSGDGDSVPEGKQDCGGCFVEITIHYPWLNVRFSSGD